MFIAIRHLPRKTLADIKYVEVKDKCFVKRVPRKPNCDTCAAFIYACIEAYRSKNRPVGSNLAKCYEYVYRKFGVHPTSILEYLEDYSDRFAPALPMKTVYIPLIKKVIIPDLLRKYSRK